MAKKCKKNIKGIKLTYCKTSDVNNVLKKINYDSVKIFKRMYDLFYLVNSRKDYKNTAYNRVWFNKTFIYVTILQINWVKLHKDSLFTEIYLSFCSILIYKLSKYK